MKWFSTVLNVLRKLPLAKFVKPLWKGGLKMAAQKGGDRLQAELDAQLREQGEMALAGIEAKVDGLQARFNAIVDGLPFPASFEQAIKDAVNGPVDALQLRLAQACASGAVDKAQAAFDAAFDAFQLEVAAKIDAL